jgi:hypothetical protein
MARHPPAGVGLARPAAVTRALANRPGLGPQARAAVEALTSSGNGFQRLAPGPLLAQACIIEAAQEAWEASGHRVAVVTRTVGAADRWKALTGALPPPPPPGHATVVVVDNADRIPAAQLYRHVVDSAARRAKIVLVEGGTGPAPGGVTEPQFERLREILPAVEPGPVDAPLGLAGPVRGGLDQTVSVAATTHDALAALVGDWAEKWSGRAPPVMVGLGREEAAALNAAARGWLAGQGVLHGPVVRSGPLEWQAGDELRVLRRHRLFRAVPAGTIVTVTAVDPRRAAVTIRWPAGTTTLQASELAGAPVRHAHAVTPPCLRACAGQPILCLGVPAGWRLPEGRPSTLYVVAHVQTGRHKAPDVAMAWRAGALGVAAEARPSRTVLAELGPPPPGDRERQAWRTAAAGLEAFRDRWGLPDDPRGWRLDGPVGGADPARQADRLRVITACRALGRAPALDRGPGVGR